MDLPQAFNVFQLFMILLTFSFDALLNALNVFWLEDGNFCRIDPVGGKNQVDGVPRLEYGRRQCACKTNEKFEIHISECSSFHT